MVEESERRNLSRRSHARATVRAAAWVRDNHPHKWDEFLEAAYVHFTGHGRRRPGRPYTDDEHEEE